MGWAAAVLIVALLIFFVFANSDGGRRQHLLRHRRHQAVSFHQILQAFWTNIWVACVAEVLVLIFGLLVAIVRMLPGRAGAPLRAIAVRLLRRLPGHPGDRGRSS